MSENAFAKGRAARKENGVSLPESQFVMLAIAVIVAFLIIDVSIEMLFFEPEGSFWNHLTTPEPHETYYRVILISFIIGIGVVSQIAISRARKSESAVRSGQENLSRLHKQNELILNSAVEGILGLDAEGNHTFVNLAATKMLGYEAEELIGRLSHIMWHHTKSDGSPYPREECKIYAAYRDGTVHRSSEEVFWRKDGTSFPVEYMSTPIHESGRLVGAVVSFTDITERNRAGEALYRANASLETRVSQSSEISRALINDIGIQRATGIIYGSGWKIGLEEARPLRAGWKGDAKSFANDFFERHATAISFLATLAEFDARTHHAQVRMCPVDSMLDMDGAAYAEMAYAQGFIAATLSVAFGKPVGIRKAADKLNGNGIACHVIETRELEPYEVEAYRLE